MYVMSSKAKLKRKRRNQINKKLRKLIIRITKFKLKTRLNKTLR